MSQEHMNYNYNYSYYSNNAEMKPITSTTIRTTNNSLYKELESDDCKRCQKYIYPLELMGPIMGFKYHRQCFRCNACDRLLDFKTYRTNLDDINDRQIYCVNHNPRTGHHNDFISNRTRSKSPAFNQHSYLSYNRNKSSENLDSLDYSSRAVPLNLRPLDVSTRSNDKLYEYSSLNEYGLKGQSIYDENNKIPVNIKINSNSNSIGAPLDKNINIEESLRKDIRETSHHERKSSTGTSSSFETKTHSHSHSESYSYFKNNDSNNVYNILPSVNVNDKQANSNRYNDYFRTNSLDRSANNYNVYESDHPKHLSNIMAEMISHDKSVKSSSNYDFRSSGSHNNLKNILDDARRSNQHLNETNNEITYHLKNIVSDIVANNKQINNNSNIKNNYYHNYDSNPRRTSSSANSHSHSNSISSEISSKENYNYEIKPSFHDIVVDTYDKNKSSNNINVNENSNIHNLSNNSNGIAVHSSFSHSSSHVSSTQTTITEHIIRPGNGSYSNLAINNQPQENSFHNNFNNNLPISNVNNNTKPSNFNEFTNLNPNSKSPYLNSIIADILGKNTNSTSNFVNTNGYKPINNRPIEINANEVNKIIGDDRGLGVIRLTVHYDELRTRLSITIHEARNLRNLEKNNNSDPYARIYLLPDEKPSLKRKTKIIKNNLNPIWQETFDYPMTYNDAMKKEITINLKDERGLFEKQEGKFLGEVIFKLRSVDLKQPFTRWFYLQPINSPLNYKFEL